MTKLPNTAPDRPPKKRRTNEGQTPAGIFEFCQTLMSTGDDQLTEDDRVSSELKRYYEHKVDISDANQFDVFKWWSLHHLSYPLLSSIARKFLSLPASSLGSERGFSWIGYQNQPRRNRMAPTTLNTRTRIHFNLKVIKIFGYDERFWA
jgi:hypothetical protein